MMLPLLTARLPSTSDLCSTLTSFGMKLFRGLEVCSEVWLLAWMLPSLRPDWRRLNRNMYRIVVLETPDPCLDFNRD